MYVLHHADKPEIYAGLPNVPRISPIIEVWKGITKYAGLAVMGFAATFGFIHYLVKGPNRVSDQDENAAKRLAGERTP